MTRHRAGAAPVTAPAVLVAMVLVAMVLVACGSSPAAEADATTTTVAGDPVPVDVAAPPIIPDLELTPLATHDPAWGAMKGAADRLYVEREGSEDQYRIARLDPETGAILYGTDDALLGYLGISSIDELPPIAPFLDDPSEGFEE